MRVLVADDDVTCRLVMQKTVEKLGHDCVVTNDGNQAWEACQADHFDVLITDWMMPGMDGPELCRRMRQRTDVGYTYIILATALGQHENVLEGMEAGADDYLTKPIVPFDLRARLIAARRVTDLHKQVNSFHSELERLNVELARQARTDPLTGVGNRLCLHEDLRRRHDEAVRDDAWYSLAICDLDDFKRYNDTYGHLEGDEALRKVATTLAETTRATDRVYRYGGEEFVVFFGGQTLEEGVAGMERLRHAVESLAIVHEGRTPPGLLTISVGIAARDPLRPETPATLLAAADRALYQAKHDGRNRTVAASLTAEPVPTA